MQSADFKRLRAIFDKTQVQMAQLLGVSTKAIHSYEQGWRSIPVHVERQMLFLYSRFCNPDGPRQMCWDISHCPDDKKQNCPAWEFNSGDCCWLINGTICHGQAHKKWAEKIVLCRQCKVFQVFLRDAYPPGS